jgi:hypothetical protein
MNPIAIRVSDDLTLDAGSIEETPDQFVIHPPDTPMIDQLLAYLEDKPYHYSGIQIRHMAVGFTALCVRWGSYLATLMDGETDLHPAVPGFHKEQPREYSFISNSEMKRLNIEISYNIYHVVQFFRERGDHDLWGLLTKARDYLPMPHKQVRKNRQAVNEIYASLVTGAMMVARFERSEDQDSARTGSNGTPEPPLRQVAPENADRVLANVLANQAWRGTIIEDIHAGRAPMEALQPHEQRFNRKNQLAVLREVTANMGSVLFTMDMLFDPDYAFKDLPVWPQTATAVANSFHGISASDWSLTDSSSRVTLRKSAKTT